MHITSVKEVAYMQQHLNGAKACAACNIAVTVPLQLHGNLSADKTPAQLATSMKDQQGKLLMLTMLRPSAIPYCCQPHRRMKL